MIRRFSSASKRPAAGMRLRAVPTALLLALAIQGCSGCRSCQSAERAEPSSSAAAAGRPRAKRLPKIDTHLHVDLRAGEEALAILAENGIDVGLNASGGEPGGGLEASIAFAKAHDQRLLPFCNVSLWRMRFPDFAGYARQVLTRCRDLGGKGLKLFKYLGLGLTDEQDRLVPVDDPRLDPLFEIAGELGLPVLIHSGDPKAFFEPNTPSNERYAELRVHPGWSFYGNAPNGQPWPSWEQLLAENEARIARHPHTQFIGAHFGNAAEEPERVARMLRKYPNYFIDTAARVPEFGRHEAARIRRFFIEFQDRILFGSDLGVGPSGLTLGSGGTRPGTRPEAKVFFDRHWAYFETAAKGMPHPTPIQGNWTVDGIDLPEPVLAKFYAGNAERLFHITLPGTPHD